MAPYSGQHASPTTNIFDYSRGLDGVNVPQDVLIVRLLCATIGLAAVVVFGGRIALISVSYLRHVTSLGASQRQQMFWSIEGSTLWANIKKHLLYAPLGKKRHNREIQMSRAANMGTVPSRFHSTLLVIYIVSQIAYCSLLNYAVKNKAALAAELRGRAGNLAVLNMVPLFILAGRNNPLISLLHVSFDTYNLFHRWLGRMVVIESIVHTLAWAIDAAHEQNFADAMERVRTTPFFYWGAAGTLAMIVLACHSVSPIRHAFYETFLHVHQLTVFLAVLGIYLHLDLDSLPQVSWVKAIIAIWSLERIMRLMRLIYLNLSLRDGRTTLMVQALPGEACRVTFHLPRRVHVGPGSHVYAYIPSVALWMSHPFSVAWVEPSSCVTTPAGMLNGQPKGRSSALLCLEKQAPMEPDFLYDSSKQPTSVSLIVSARTGMTRKLYNKASRSPNETLHLSGFIEGPYSSHHSSLGSYGTAILFSGGAGITHHLLHVRDLLMRAADGCVATRRIYLIWSVRHVESLSWVRTYMDSILQLPNRRQILRIKLFVSKPRSRQDIYSPSETLQMFSGRCRPAVILDEALPGRVGATVVSVCGPGAFADDVRAAARQNIGKGMAIDFIEESFTW
ncbi:Ferric reductase like transmembrane component domain containing protein [Elaphomyces granulatus]